MSDHTCRAKICDKSTRRRHVADMSPTFPAKAVVSRLKNGQAAGATGMRAEHVKTWLSNIWHEEKVARENPGRIADTGDLSKKMVDLCQDDSGHLGPGGNPDVDELDGCHPAAKGQRQLPGDWIA
jgi:hypothetical protein